MWSWRKIKQLWKENMILAELWYELTGTISVQEWIGNLKKQIPDKWEDV